MIVSKPFTFSTGATIVASEHNSNFDTLYNDHNGNIDNSNLAASANIADSKLAQITTFGKVKASSIGNLSTLAVAAGSIPIANGGLGADLSTAGVGSVPYFASIGTMTALASGTSGYFLMATSATSTPVFSKPAAMLGVWDSSTYTVNTPYLAATDGFVLTYSSTQNVSGLTDSANPPTIERAKATRPAGACIPICMPVRKGDYWKITSVGVDALHWIPLGA